LANFPWSRRRVAIRGVARLDCKAFAPSRAEPFRSLREKYLTYFFLRMCQQKMIWERRRLYI
jgi:hypothetical protein